MTAPRRPITSRENPLLQDLRRLQRDPAAYRRLGKVWLEGEHLCSAWRDRGGEGGLWLFSESAAAQPALAALAGAATRQAVVPDRLFAELSTLPSPAGIGCLIDLPPPGPLAPGVPTVVLDRVQDAGNVGSILRSASALGVRQVIALKGTAALWSPKVLRSGMGAQFALGLHEGLDAVALAGLGLPLVATSSHATQALPEAPLPWPCAWVFGHEGQGVAAELEAGCALTVRIPQPGGEESLNVAAAAAICLYESLRRRSAQ